MPSRVPLVVLVTLAVAACTGDQPNLGSHPKEPPTFPPVEAGDEERCSKCMRNEPGLCRLEERGYCAGGPKGVSEVCFYEVPCDETCCDRFPIVGGFALVRPGRWLWERDFTALEDHRKVARIPDGGLLVRVVGIDQDKIEDGKIGPYVEVKTLGLPSPGACKGVVDDLAGVILWAWVSPKDLKPAPKACRDAAYALDASDGREYGIYGRLDGRDAIEFDPAPYGDARVIKAETLINYPARSGDSGDAAGVIIDHIVLDAEEPIERDRNMLCYRLPGILRPRLCSKVAAIHNAP